MFFKGEPLYPFGYGLSYTTFRYYNLRLSSPVLKDAMTIMVDVTNTGDRVGDEVVQLYVSHENSKMLRPIKELKGFSRITLRPTETKTVSFRIGPKDLAYWNVARHRFETEKDLIKFFVGGSSADQKLTGSFKVL